MFAFAITHELCFTNVLYIWNFPHPAPRRRSRTICSAAPHRRGADAPLPRTARPVHGPHAPREGEEWSRIVRPRDQGPRRSWSRSRLIENRQHSRRLCAVVVHHDANGVLTPLKPICRRPTPYRADFDRPHIPKSSGPVRCGPQPPQPRNRPRCTRVAVSSASGVLYRPARERSLPNLEKILENCLNDTVRRRILPSLSTGDFSALKPCSSYMTAAKRTISVSLPSLPWLHHDDIMPVCGIRLPSHLAPEAAASASRHHQQGLTEEG